MNATRTPDPRHRQPRQSLARALWGEVWEALLPQRCIACGQFGAALHEECLGLLPVAGGSRCDRCWRPGARLDPEGRCERCAPGEATLAFDALRAPFRFEGLARRALLEAKFRGITAHLGPLGRAAAEVVPARWRPDVVVPVPLGRRRERARGFNQACEAARAVAEALDVPLADGVVRRGRETAPQAMLDAAARQGNIRGAFVLAGTPPARVLVVDDVTTTGATLSAMAAALRAGGSTHVFALALGRED
ncbi:MAG: ComF family protein [Dehalococcoidia bacterium]